MKFEQFFDNKCNTKFSIKKKKPRINETFLMPLAGLEPARCYPLDFESSASANSATAACAVRSHVTYIIINHA